MGVVSCKWLVVSCESFFEALYILATRNLINYIEKIMI